MKYYYVLIEFHKVWNLMSIIGFPGSLVACRQRISGQASKLHPTFIPTGESQTTDGYIIIEPPGDKMWNRFYNALSTADFRGNPVYANDEADHKFERHFMSDLKGIFKQD